MNISPPMIEPTPPLFYIVLLSLMISSTCRVREVGGVYELNAGLGSFTAVRRQTVAEDK